MDILKSVLMYIVYLMIAAPVVAYTFSWCCNIYFARKAKHEGTMTAFNLIAQKSMENLEKKKNDPPAN